MKKIIGMMIVGCLCISMLGCALSKDDNISYDDAQEYTSESSESDTVTTDTQSSNTSLIEVTTSSSYDENDATVITASGTTFTVNGSGAEADTNTVTITQKGTYIVSGTMENGQIIVETENGKDVQIVLKEASLTCNYGAPIYVKNAGSITITAADQSTNEIHETSEYQYTDTTTEEQNAALFSTDDLILNGTGTIEIAGNYAHGIKAKDTLIIEDITLIITAVEDGINANEDILISSGNISISAGDDAVHTDLLLTINDGTINITKCYEGLEGCQITIHGGDITLVSSDDGINAANKEGSDYLLTIIGGTVSMTVGGDGVDSNGSIIMSGGYVEVFGPTNDGNGSIDYENSFVMTGGMIVAAGSSQMAMTTNSTSSQNGLMVYFTQAQSEGTTYQVTDSEGNVMVEVSPTKNYSCIYVCSPDLVQGETYSISTNGTKLCEVTLSGINTSIASDGTAVSGGMNGGMGGNMNGGMGGNMNGGMGTPPGGHGNRK